MRCWRARRSKPSGMELARHPQLFPVLAGLSGFYNVRGEQTIARELGEKLLRLAENAQDQALLRTGHTTLGIALNYLGEAPAACAHFQQGLAGRNPQRPSPSGISCLAQLAHVLWRLGYPDQAISRAHEALVEARQLSLPFWVGYAMHFTTVLHSDRREEWAAQEQAEIVIALSTEHGFPFWLGWATLLRGRVLAVQGQSEAGIRQIHEGLDI